MYSLMKVCFSYTVVLWRTVSTTCDVFDITSYMKLVFAENLPVRGRPTYDK